MARGRGDDDKMFGGGCAACCCFVILFVSSFLLGFSWRTVNYDEYGLVYNEVTNEVFDEPGYEPGRYFVGLGKNFYRFNKTYQNIEFSRKAAAEKGAARDALSVRATDGQILIVELSFQYAIRKETLRQLYNDFKFDYETFYATKARGEMSIVASRYDSEEIYGNNRQVVEDEMKLSLQGELNSRHADLVGFQLRYIDLPDTLDNTLLEIQLKRQLALKQAADVEATQIRYDTEAMVQYLRAESTNLITAISQDTELSRVRIMSNVSSILAETSRLIDAIRVLSSTNIEVYSQETENERLALAANLSVIQETTEQMLIQVDLETDALKAEAEARMVGIRAEGEAARTNFIEPALAEADGLWQQAKSDAFAQMASAVGLTADQTLHLQYMTAIEPHDAEKLLMDLYSPSALKLAGQEESYYKTMSG